MMLEAILGRIWIAKDVMFLHAGTEDCSDCVDAQADQSLRLDHTPEGTFSYVAALMLTSQVKILSPLNF